MAIDHSVYGDLLAPIERLAGRVPDGIVTEDEQVPAEAAAETERQSDA